MTRLVMCFLAFAFSIDCRDGFASAQPHTGTFRLVLPDGSRNVQAAELFVDVTYGDGAARGAVVVFFDPQTRLACWLYTYTGAGPRPGLLEYFRKGSVLYLAGDTLVFFTTRGSSLSVRTSTERAASLADALRAALTAVEAKKSELTKLVAATAGSGVNRFVPLSDVAGDFFSRAGDARTYLPRVVSVSCSGGEWQVTVSGPDDARAVVTLNASYELRGFRRVR